MSWERTVFEHLYEIPSKNGLTRPSRDRGQGYKMINMGELFGNDRIGSIEMELVKMNKKELESMLVQEGDLLFARQSLVLAGAGKCSIVQEVQEPTTFESHIIRIRLKREIVNPVFYYYYFKSPSCGIKSIVTQGVQAGIRGNDLKNLKVHIPPIVEQDKIADILSAYDDLIENNRRRIQLLEESARLLYKEWFVHLRFPGHEHVKITDGVPEGWERKNLFDVSDVTYGFAFKSSLFSNDGVGLPVVRIRDVPHRASKTFTTEEATEDKLLENGDFLIGMDGDFHMNYWCGGKAWLNQRVVRILGANGVSTGFIKQAIEKPIQNFNETITGTTVRHLGAKHLKMIDFIFPEGEILNEANDYFEAIREQVVILQQQNKPLTQARDLLLPKLMNGEIAV